MLRMIDTDTALGLVERSATPRCAVELPVDEALGLTLVEPVCADRDYPPFVRAMMDGYAVKLAHAGRTVPVTGEVAAGDPTARVLPADSCFEIMTGAPCPEGTEAVVMKEHVERKGDSVRLPLDIQPQQHMVERGSECSAGETRLAAGTVVTPMAAGLTAAFGQRTVRVVRRPTLAVITTGSELVVDGDVGPSQIRDSNSHMLTGMARAAGVADIHRQHAIDTLEALATALERAAERDIIVLSGGVSAGKYDLVPRAIEDFGGTAVFHKVRQKPGKPLLFATRGDTSIFGLPGTPLGSHLGFHRYVAPAIRLMMGHDVDSGWGRGVLTTAVETRGERTKFFLARAARDGHFWNLTSVWGGSSSNLYAPAAANAYIRVPGGEHSLPAGSTIEFQWTLGGAR